MIPPPFRYLAPATITEALALLAEIDGAVVLAGGQSLINALKLDLVSPPALVDVHRIPELRTVDVEDDLLRIGAAVTYRELAENATVRRALPELAQVAATLVDRQVRNRGTVGGNCCLNDPTNNLPPLLAALDARFAVCRPGGPEESLAADEFFLGSLLTAASAPAMLTAVTVPISSAQTRVSYRHQLIGADSWALARAVVRADVTDGVMTTVRVVLGALPGSPIRLPDAEQVMTGRPPRPDVAEAAFDTGAMERLEIVGDAHASAEYRRTLAGVQLRRALRDVTSAWTPPVEEAA